MTVARDPFRSSVNITERLEALKKFNAAECRAAFKAPALQATVKAALDRRLDKLVDHHHRRKAKGKQS